MNITADCVLVRKSPWPTISDNGVEVNEPGSGYQVISIDQSNQGEKGHLKW